MGAYAPVTPATPALLERVRREVMLPALVELDRRGARFQGCLYAGIMVDPTGAPFVVEFNCRFGDPETQVVLPLLAGGLTTRSSAWRRGSRPGRWPCGPGHPSPPCWPRAATPTPRRRERKFPFPDVLPEGVTVFHAGTSRGADGVLRASGGRVLNVTAVAPTFREAQARSREGAEAIAFEGKTWRRDIGWREAETTAGQRGSGAAGGD